MREHWRGDAGAAAEAEVVLAVRGLGMSGVIGSDPLRSEIQRCLRVGLRYVRLYARKTLDGDALGQAAADEARILAAIATLKQQDWPIE